MTFSRKILVGLVLGVATGLFLGDRAAPLPPRSRTASCACSR